MGIPASYIASITPRVISAGSEGLKFNGLVFTENVLLPVGIVKSFISAESVSDYFGTESDEYQASLLYFAGYVNSFVKPQEFKIVRRVLSPAQAFIRGGAFKGTLVELQAITDGALDITIDNVAVALTGISFVTATSLSEVASLLQTSIAAKSTGATVSYSSLFNAFQINSGTTGTTSAISFATEAITGTDLGALFNLALNNGATVSQGSDVLTATDQLKLIVSIDANFATITTLYVATLTEAIDISSWVMSKNVDYLYLPWYTGVDALDADLDTDLATELASAGQTNYMAVYGDYKIAVAIQGIIGSIDFGRLNGAIDIAFKSVQGLVANVDDEDIAVVLDEKKYNYCGKFATRNSDFVFIYKGSLEGIYTFAAAYVNAIWLNNSIQLSFMSGLTSIGTLPYGDTGNSFIRSWVSSVIVNAVNNGVIVDGILLSESQKAILTSEVGEDVSADMSANGYYLQVLEAGAEVRATGASPEINLWYTDGGGIKKLSMSSTLIK